MLHMHRPGPTLARRLDAALTGDGWALDDLSQAEPVDEHDAMVSLLTVHDLHVAPIEKLAGRVRWQHHPAVAALKGRLEERFVARIEERERRAGWNLPAEPAAALRSLAAIDRVPPMYEWLAERASLEELRTFLALEGGPDGGFDDLVASCQTGLDGEAKLEMARNYWDEMGNGEAADVHTELHRRFARALGIEAIPRTDQPLEALDRAALGSLLATNRGLQPEMVGALGLIELQAGPRCRKVLAGLTRLGAPADTFPFYEVHAVVDPKHGKDWVDHVVAPLGDDPFWADGIIRGARWRWLVNDGFLAAVAAAREEPAWERHAS
jgi:hypothetical protein